MFYFKFDEIIKLILSWPNCNLLENNNYDPAIM